MTIEDDKEYARLMQAQIASAEAARHLIQQEAYGFRTVAGKAVRKAFGLRVNLPSPDVLEVLDAYIQEMEDEVQRHLH